MDIVDSQIHLFMTMDDEDAVRIMDHIGIRSALIDEAWDFGDQAATGTPDEGGELMPAFRLPNGAWRPIAPGGITASLRRPDRFGYFLRINPEDPDLDHVMRETAASPGGKAFRLDVRTPQEVRAYAEGQRRELFRTAERLAMPVFICTMGRAPDFEQYIRDCPSLPVIFDHCGVPQSAEDFDRLLALAAYPNVFVKWCHAPLMFQARAFPFVETRPWLARALDGFGRERLMWASDFTAVDYGAKVRNEPGLAYNWAEALFHMRCNPELSEGDLEWVLGRTARTVLNWAV
jgi:predicted TIM-barrel fold metal-dependent hydrolase